MITYNEAIIELAAGLNAAQPKHSQKCESQNGEHPRRCNCPRRPLYVYALEVATAIRERGFSPKSR